VLADTFSSAYPVVQNSYKSLRYLLQLQDTARAYIAEASPENLSVMRNQFEKIAKTGESLIKRVASRVEGDEKRQEIARIAEDFQRLRAMSLTDNGLFALHDRSLASEERMRELTASLDAVTHRYDEATSIVVREAKRLMDDASKEVQSTLAAALLGISAIIAVSIAFGLLAAGLLGGNIVRPVRRLTETMQRLARGDTDLGVPDTERRDELGVMAVAVQVFKENAIERLRLETERTVELEAKEKRTIAVEKMITDFDGSMGTILRTVASAATELDSTAQSMSATAEETSRQAAASANAAEQTSANVQTAAAAAEEMTGSLQEIARQVTHSTGIANGAVTQAERTDVTVQGLAEAAQKINQVVGLIQTIAGQTNLLALNATIEAARAGEHGKGFAVVASEVKNLANQTAKATEEITAQISSIQVETSGAVTAIRGIGGTIRQMNEITTTIAAAVEEQNAATAEISRSVAHAASGTREVSLNVGQVMEASEQTGSAATQVLGAAGELSRQAEMLGAEVERFLTGIRAA
jgi:methyl-accepting chemotaxis protein